MKVKVMPRIFNPGKQADGFTLIELMVAMVISLFLLGGLLVIFVSSQNAVREAQELSRLQENLRFASDFLVRDVRNAGFRDEANLTLADWDAIGNNYVTLGDGFLEVQYAGRGSCSERFFDAETNAASVIGLVRNRYEVEDGVLYCNREIDETGRIRGRLVSGVVAFDATPIYPASVETLQCPGTCIGVWLDVTLEAGTAGSVTVPLKAVFRNRVLDKLFAE